MDLAKELVGLISTIFIIIVGFFILLPKIAEVSGTNTIFFTLLGVLLGILAVIVFLKNLRG